MAICRKNIRNMDRYVVVKCWMGFKIMMDRRVCRRKMNFIGIIVIVIALLLVTEASLEGKDRNIRIAIIVINHPMNETNQLELEFHIENIGQEPISNIILHSKSQNYATRIAMLQPGEKRIFTKGESEKLCAVILNDQKSMKIDLRAEGIIKNNGKQKRVCKEKVRIVRIKQYTDAKVKRK